MYAIIRAGGKQHKGKARSSRSELSKARVTAKVLGEAKGPKVEVMKYRNKTGYRRNTGHRQRYSSVQISDIKLTAGRSTKSAAEEPEQEEES
jgi:ribosomal protein L21